MGIIVQRDPQPQVHIRGDATTQDVTNNDAVQTLRRAGVRKVGFVSGPERPGQ